MSVFSGAEVSIINKTFARKVGCMIDQSQTQEFVGIGEITYMSIGRTKIKITLDGSLVYCFDVWVEDQVGQDAILGTDFMVLQGSVWIWQTELYVCQMKFVYVWRGKDVRRDPPYKQTNFKYQHVVITIGGSTEVRIGMDPPKAKLWIRKDATRVPTLLTGTTRLKYL